MTRVFVSHSSEDYYFVDFLVELLRFHRVDVWVDRSNLKAGDVFTSDIEQALADCDSMVVVISRNSSRSRWMTREISAFKAIANRPVIPLVLDIEANPNDVYEGLGLVTQLRCYVSLLDSFSELLRRLGGTLFPVVEKRSGSDRRSEDRRKRPADRRKSPIEKRLRVGMYKYIRSTGRDLLAPIDRALDVGALAKLLAADDSPLQSFDLVDRGTGEQAHLDFRAIERMAFESWYSKTEQESSGYLDGPESWGLRNVQRSSHSVVDDMTGAAYIIDDIVNDVTSSYVVTSKARRRQDRRAASRRQDEQQDL